MKIIFIVIVLAALILGLLINMMSDNATKYTLFLAILTVPLDIYRINTQPFGISIFRLIIIITLGSYIYEKLLDFNELEENKISLQSYELHAYIFIFGFFLSLIISLAIAASKDHALPHMASGIFGITIAVLLIDVIDSKTDVRYLFKSVYFSYVICIFFMIFTYYHWSQGTYISSIPFADLFPFELASSQNLKAFRTGVSGTVLPRLALPFTTPPQLSLWLVYGFFLSLYFNSTRTSLFSYGVSVSYSVLLLMAMLLTVSRTGLFTLIIVGTVYLIIYIYKRASVSTIRNLLAVSLILSFIFILIFPEEVLLARFTGSISAHLEARVAGIIFWLKDIKTTLLGVGLGNYLYYTGKSTTETNYILFLVERGLLGTALALPIFFYPGVLLSRNLAQFQEYIESYRITLTSWSIVLCILIGELFYDFIHLHYVWVFIGLCISAAIHFAPELGMRSD